MAWGEIIGHHRQVEILRVALASGRLHHAYLFVGPEGIGKRTLAIALAKAVHCSVSAADFCGSCANCQRIADGNHPDVRLIEPLAGKKEISIQQVRDFERELNYRSFTGKRKIIIIDPATLMNLITSMELTSPSNKEPVSPMNILAGEKL